MRMRSWRNGWSYRPGLDLKRQLIAMSQRFSSPPSTCSAVSELTRGCSLHDLLYCVANAYRVLLQVWG